MAPEHDRGNLVDLTDLLRQSLRGGKAPARKTAAAKPAATRRKTG